MPNPKRRHSKSRSRKRRSHDALKRVNLIACPNCGSMKLPHRVCVSCGFYHGRIVIEKGL
ncbi:MAG: 50S ribosomal protein L32 [Acidobacteria bacterium]|nr:50S ribosomal protein L32 [Acidobacteriota bacterium]